MGKIKEEIVKLTNCNSVNLSEQAERVGCLIESELQKLGERIDKQDFSHVWRTLRSHKNIIEEIQNQLEGDGIFDVKDIHRRLNIHRKELNQHKESLEALEQKPPPEPARDKDGKPEGGLKFPDFVYNNQLQEYGVFIEPGHSSNSIYFKVFNRRGQRALWLRNSTIFMGRPEPPMGDS